MCLVVYQTNTARIAVQPIKLPTAGEALLAQLDPGTGQGSRHVNDTSPTQVHGRYIRLVVATAVEEDGLIVCGTTRLHCILTVTAERKGGALLLPLSQEQLSPES